MTQNQYLTRLNSYAKLNLLSVTLNQALPSDNITVWYMKIDKTLAPLEKPESVTISTLQSFRLWATQAITPKI